LDTQRDTGGRGLFTVLSFGILASSVVVFSIYIFFARRQGDIYFTSQENLAFQEIVAIKNVRSQIAGEFINSVLHCISPPIVPGQNLTEEEAIRLISAAMNKDAGGTGGGKDGNCKPGNKNWTFEPPCILRINKSPYEAFPAARLGSITICQSAIAQSIMSSLGRCAKSSVQESFLQCLADAVMANPGVKSEIDSSFSARVSPD
jgi:hypothetical protein